MGANRKVGDRLVGDAEVANRLSMSRSWVRQQRRKRREGQPHVLTIDPVMIGERSVRYVEAELDALVNILTAANDNNAAVERDQAPEVDGSAWDVYVDGSCIPNPGPGGYAFVAYHDGEETEFADGEAETTNNCMEMKAAIAALQSIPPGSVITVYSDSQYVILGITEWIHKWKAKGWRNAAGKPVANQDLWEQLDEARQRQEVEWVWIRGHDNVPGHDRADALARAEAERQARNARPVGRGAVR